MKRIIGFVLVLTVAVVSTVGVSQITEPAMRVTSFDEVDANHNADGRVVQRLPGSGIGMIRVEWPAGTATTPHNHANELMVMVLEGRLRAISGGREQILEPGDVAIFPSWVDHGYEALEDSVTIEAYGPG